MHGTENTMVKKTDKVFVFMKLTDTSKGYTLIKYSHKCMYNYNSVNIQRRNRTHVCTSI